MKPWVLALALAASGCASGYRFTTTPTNVRPAKPFPCEFRVTETMPAGYEEIGMFEPKTQNLGLARDVATFREMVGPDVCRAGGEIVLTQADAKGAITRATVLVKPESPAAGTAKP